MMAHVRDNGAVFRKQSATVRSPGNPRVPSVTLELQAVLPTDEGHLALSKFFLDGPAEFLLVFWFSLPGRTQVRTVVSFLRTLNPIQRRETYAGLCQDLPDFAGCR